MKKHTNNYGVEHWTGVTSDTIINRDFFQLVESMASRKKWAMHTNMGILTIVCRITGSGMNDIETGYREPETGKFWLASGGFDVRETRNQTMQACIDWVKDNANTCVGV